MLVSEFAVAFSGIVTNTNMPFKIQESTLEERVGREKSDMKNCGVRRCLTVRFAWCLLFKKSLFLFERNIL